MNETTPKVMTLPEIGRALREYPTLQAVRESLIRDQWQTPKKLSVDCTAFLIFKIIQNELFLCDDSDILLRSDKIVIPQALQHKTVDIAEPMTIISKKGSMLIEKNHRRSITRNLSHFKKVSMMTAEPPEEIET